MRYLFDTTAVLIYLRDPLLRKTLDDKYSPLADEHTAVVSVVTLGEVASIAIRNRWGSAKRQRTEAFLNQFVITDINAQDVIATYGEIDAYSQNKLPTKELGMSARNMEKNDLWIAATAAVANSSLISSDRDFLHLKDIYFDLLHIDVEKKTIS